MARVALLGAFLCGCGSEIGSSAAPSPGGAIQASTPSEGRIMHEAQLVADSSLKLDFSRQIALDHLETTGPQRGDSGSPGWDLIPFRSQGDGPQNYRLATPLVSRAEVLDASGRSLANLQAGDNLVDLPAGDFQLKLTGTGPQAALIAIGRPVPPAIRPLLQPGIEIQELASFPIVQSAPTAVTLFVGAAAAGPSQTVTSFAQFVAQNGQASSPLTLAVNQFFQNGGQTAIIQPVADASPVSLNAGLQAASWLDFNLLVLPDLYLLSPGDADLVTPAALALALAHKGMFLSDVPDSVTDPQQIEAWLQSRPSLQQPQVVAYWPAIQVYAPDGSIQTVGPASSMAGVFATVDTNVGVWQNPAGPAYPLHNVRALNYPVAQSDLVLLGPLGINGLIDSSQTILCYGERTLDHQLVARRRLQNYLDLSLSQSLQWVVFEPASPSLTAAITNQISQFMSVLWEIGGLFGDTSSQAFQVQCSTLNNLVNITLAYAPQAAGQFQVFKLSAQTQEPLP